MKFAERLSSRHFFVFNLVLIGVLFGFSLAFVSFSCSTPPGGKPAEAQENPLVIPQDALAVAESLQTSFRAVAERVLPSVVEIKTVSVRRPTLPNGIPPEFFFGPRDQEPNRGPERQFRSQGVGSGIIVRQNGDLYYVITNFHVVDGVTEVSIAVEDGREYPAEIVGTNERRDLAMVSFRTSDRFPLAVLGDSDSVRVGDWAIAIGNPMGLMSTVTMGIVSAIGRTGGPAGNINDFIQTDTSINRGNSGGALVNIRGEVIGIPTWIASDNGGGSMGLGFAIPINNAKRTIDEFINKGEISDGWLGVSLIDTDRDLAQALGLTGKRGALAVQVFIDSPAHKGGLQPGDYITHLDGAEIRDRNALTRRVGDLRAGAQVTFTVFRDGASHDLRVRIEARAAGVDSDGRKLWPGVYAVPITDAIRQALHLNAGDQGVIVAEIQTESPAAVIGLQREDRIISLNGEAVRDLAAFYRLLRERTGRELWFEVVRNGSRLETLRFKR
ncbi:MAG: Do family serine endopeptidase [Spirochaetaceae bacterium]|jgi:Do/DeqQ family serine protease|nr:Do family serine endopeptidase [Spirochaetaceae bacterium]